MFRLSFTLLMFSLPLAASLYAQSLTERLTIILDSPRDTHQVRDLTNLYDDFFDASLDVPEILFHQGLEVAQELNDVQGLAELSVKRYVFYLNAGDVEKGLPAVAEAIRFAKASGREYLIRKASLHEVLLFMISGDTEKGAKRASALAEEFHASGDLIGESGAYSLLSSLSAGFGNYELAVRYDSTAIALAQRSKSRQTECLAISNAAMNRCVLDDHLGALPLAEEALAIAREIGDDLEEGNAMNARAEANTALGNYAKALKDYEFLKVGEGESKFTWRMTNKGVLLQRLGRHDEARAILLEAVDILKKTSNDPMELERCYRGLQTVGLDQAQYDTVVWYGKLMTAQQDSLQIAKNNRSILELEEKYQTGIRKGEISDQQDQLVLRRIQLYVTIFGLLLALVAGFSLFRLSQRLRKKNVENEQLLTDKETLIGEIHHRVKNNLQVISSLLQLQRRGLNSDDAKGSEALLESQNRVGAMALIHNKLYQGVEVASVRMPDYLKDLGEALIGAYRLEEQVEIYYDVGDFRLDVDTAIPLGLIINELVTNSLKYAFPNGREGTIEIALHRDEDQFRLVVSDNGVGDAAAEKRADSTSFGNNLIGMLTRKLKGSLRQLEGQGYGVEIVFVE